MDRFVTEALLYTSDFGEDSYLYNSSSSTDSSDDNEDSCCKCSGSKDTQIARSPNNKQVKVDGFVEIEIPMLNAYDFKNSFRMSRSTFEKVVEMIGDSFISDNRGGRGERVSPEKATYILLWYLGNQETLRQISDRFKKSITCIRKVIKIGTRTLSLKMCEQIVWPSKQEYPSIASMFQNVCHLKNCIGVLGVSHIKIPKPKIMSSSHCYVALQGTVTINKKFINIYVSEGSDQPESILEKSPLQEEAAKDIFGEYYLVGYNDYMNRSWLIQPFRNDEILLPAQQFFNNCHETASLIFPESLGVLKGRFQRLQHFENKDVPIIVSCIEAACTLHNLVIDSEEDDTEEFNFQDSGIFRDNVYVESLDECDYSTRMKIFQELVRSSDVNS
ncbi:unnamed protein product [Phyllotreta striolata]|uniref:DDE Tnp4 domain-containing protein n=1 Tax=Phyllotreta striolata TaxID=444603 RepID=A0A9N9TSE9_PHYSR|nr:unnamed protein product [Phyllotreta striolata]